MKKILFFLSVLTGGGAERTIINIANGLDKKKFVVYLLIINQYKEGKYKDEYSDFIEEGISVINIKKEIVVKNYPLIIWEMSKVIRNIQPDIAMSTMLHENMIFTVALKLAHFKGRCILRESTNRTAIGTTTVERLFMKYMYGKYAYKVIALSFGVRDNLRENFGIPDNKIEVIYNPVDLKKINELMLETQESIQQGDVINIVAVGRLTRQKNYPLFLKALQIINKKCSYNAYILGQGELEDQIHDLIKKYNLSDKVKLLGFQKNPYKYMSNADIFVLSSSWEGFGHVIVEAMACGAMVISTDCQYGPGEIITNEVDGLLVQVDNEYSLADALKKAAEDLKLRKKLIENAKKRALDFDCKKIVLHYEDIFIRS